MKKIFIFPFRILKDKIPAELVLHFALKNFPNPKGKICYIAPTQRKVNETKGIFKTSNNIDFYNPDSFTGEIYNEYSSRRVIDEKTKLLLILDILSSTEKFKKIFGNSTGTISLIFEFINNLKFCLYQNEIPLLRKKVEKLLNGYDLVKEQGLLAIDIFETYENVIKGKNIIDEIDKKLEVANIIEKNKINFDICVFDGFYDLPKVEEILFEKIINNSKNVLAIVYHDKRIDEIQNLENDFLIFLNKFKDFEISEEKPNYKIRIKNGEDVIKAISIEDEVTSVARAIRYLGEEEKIKEEDIIVTFPSMYAYIPYIERIFKKYNINFTTSVEKSFSSFPQVIPVITLLECILENYPRRKIIDIVTSNYFNRFSSKVKDLISIVSRKAGIVCGLGEWLEIDIRIKDNDKKFYEKYQKDIELIKKELEEFFKLTKINKKISLSEFVLFLKNLLDGLRAEITNEEVKKVFNEILDSFISHTKIFGEKHYDFVDICLMFKNILARTNFEKEYFHNGVKVLGILETRGLYAKYIFFGGLGDGDYPLKPKQEMILPDKVRKEFGLMYFERRINIQRLHFYRLIESSEIDTFLSYPMQEKDKVILPSNFLPQIINNVKHHHFNLENVHFNEEERQRHNGGLTRKEFEGFKKIEFMNPDEMRKIIGKFYGEDKYISVTVLDKYIKCPFIFYIEEVLKILPFKEPTYELDNATFGKIVHSVMKDTFKEGEKNIDNIRKSVYISLDDILNKERLKPFWKDFIKNKIDFIVDNIVKEETKLMNVFPNILYLEKYVKAEIIPNKLRLKGKIDRVDINGDNFLVIDYKTGSGISGFITDTNKIRSLQLALYAKIVMVENSRLSLGGLGVYNLREGRIKFIGEKILNNLIEEAVKKAEEIVHNIRNTNFTKIEEKNCWRCRYKGVC
ncbi:MAG: PD-(D/E)XK nuclease family protein [Candidatus Firestonebacteria bacterium]